MIQIIILFISIVSGEYMIEKEYGFVDRASVFVINKCISSPEDSFEFRKVNQTHYKTCIYTDFNCSMNEDCGNPIDLASENLIYTSELPSHIAYAIVGKKEDCSDHSNANDFYIFYSDCKKSGQHRNNYVKYSIENNTLYSHYYTDNKCSILSQSGNAKREVDKCDICVDGNKYYCKAYPSSNGSVFTSIILYLFGLFFFLF